MATADALGLLRSAAPPLLYGVRVAVAVGISLAIAFALQLENPSWAGTTAALVCQPVLGSSLRKGLFRSLGTLVGALATVTLFALFPQDRVGFALGLAAWCAICGFVGSRLTFFAAYAALLAGYTAAILAGDLVNSPDQAFDVTLARVVEILLGIAVATFVLAMTQVRNSHMHLAAALRGIAAHSVAGLLSVLAPASIATPSEQDAPGEDHEHALLSRLLALDAVIDQVSGEAGHWRFSLGAVRAGQDGLFVCIAEAGRLRQDGRAGLDAAWRLLPSGLREGSADLLMLQTAVDMLSAGPNPERSATVRVADALSGAATALKVAAWLENPRLATPASATACLAPADPLPALVNAARVYAAVMAAMLVWMATRWPDGPHAVTFAAILTLLMSPQHEGGVTAATRFVLGTMLTACLAAVASFAVLPVAPQAMWGLAAALALFLVPLAALSTIPRLTPVFGPAMMNFVPLTSPANEMTYDTVAFYNSALAILAGCLAAAMALRIVAPVPAPMRARRIVATARDEREAVASGAWRPTEEQWADRMRTRAAGLPASAAAAAAEVLHCYSQGADAIRMRTPAVAGGARWS